MSKAFEGKVVLVTGANSGIGETAAVRLQEAGATVFGLARREDAIAAARLRHPRIRWLLADVTNEAQVTAAVQTAVEEGRRLDVVVNNAGIGAFAPLEQSTAEMVRSQFEANVFGLIDTTKAVLPVMRKQRSGLIVNVSSIGGLASFAATGYYHGTKYAVEGISESLATEVKPLGIDVLIVEPGPFRTNWAGPSIKQSATQIEDYAATAGERRKQTAARSGNQAGDPVRAAQAIIDAALSDTPPLRLLLGKAALELARKKLDFLRSDFDAWEATTVGADFPEGTK